jgi:hypothetical protein
VTVIFEPRLARATVALLVVVPSPQTTTAPSLFVGDESVNVALTAIETPSVTMSEPEVAPFSVMVPLLMAAFVDEQYANATAPMSSRLRIARHTRTTFVRFSFMILLLLFS